jgi:hypothetical protein
LPPVLVLLSAQTSSKAPPDPPRPSTTTKTPPFIIATGQAQLHLNMPDLIVNLLDIKVSASSLITNLQPLIAIRSFFQADEEELQNKALEISVHCDLVATELRAIVSLCETMLNDPPGYGKDAQAQEHTVFTQALELQVL